MGLEQQERRVVANAVCLQLHALAYNLPNFLRTLALPDEISYDAIEFGRMGRSYGKCRFILL